MLDSLEIEIKRWSNDYSFSSEENGKKRIYVIYSLELRRKLREIIYPYGVLGKGNIQYEGKNSQGDRILYQQGKDELPDQLTLISREMPEQQRIADGAELQKRKSESGWENWDKEWQQTKAKWKERETELGVSPSGEKHYFSGRSDDGKIVMEGMYVKSEIQSQIFVLEKNNSPQIQQITNEESKEVEKSLVKDETRKDDEAEVFATHHQILPKK